MERKETFRLQMFPVLKKNSLIQFDGMTDTAAIHLCKEISEGRNQVPTYIPKVNFSVLHYSTNGCC